MSLLNVLSRVSDEDIAETLEAVTGDEILSTLSKPVLAIDDALILLSPQALPYLETTAKLAHERTVQQFGYTIQLFTPMYISNYCDNGCVYCGYSHRSGIAREKLSLDDIELEAKAIAETGLEQVLVLTGESKSCSPPSYIQAAVEKLVPIFSSDHIQNH